MIYYFSGTGNSKWIAEQIATLTGDTAMNIPSLIADGPYAAHIGAGERIGLIFPVYAWGAPTIVEQFCKSIQIDPSAYAYAICTCGDEAGKSMLRLKRVFAWQAAWSLAMPNNYIVGYEVDQPDLAQKKVNVAREKLPLIAEAILSRRSAYDVREGTGAKLKTTAVRPMFNLFAKRTSPFYATEDCNACGLCARICPIGAIRMDGERPVWVKKHCTQCLSCINRCPQRAIQYGEGTKNRGRYYFRDGE